MVGQVFSGTVCLCTVIIVIAFPNDNNESTITKLQLTQLEQTVSDLQKHIVAQDQKETAVLSSVLSQLTETMNKLTETTNNLTEMKDELFKLQHNYLVLENELSSLKDNYTSLDGAGKSFSRQRVAFEATMVEDGDRMHPKTFLKNSTLIFSAIQYNEGGCWNPSTGVFTASVNGTYLFWIYIRFTDVKNFSLYMKKNLEVFGEAYGHQHNEGDTAMTSLTSITQLVEGDVVYFVSNSKVKYWPNISSCGGVLLNSGLQ